MRPVAASLGVNGFILVFFSFGNLNVVPRDYHIIKNLNFSERVGK